MRSSLYAVISKRGIVCLGFISGIWVGVSWFFHNLFILMANLNGSYLDRPLVFVIAFVLKILFSWVLCQPWYLDASYCIIPHADNEHKSMLWNVPLLWQCILSWCGNGGDNLEKKTWNCLQKTPHSFVSDAGIEMHVFWPSSTPIFPFSPGKMQRQKSEPWGHWQATSLIFSGPSSMH